MNIRATLCGVLLAATLATSAHAGENVPRHWIARIGVHPISTQPNNHAELTVDNAASLSIGATYLFSEHWAFELFSAFSNTLDIRDADGRRAARFSMIPSSASVQYHITDASGRFRAFVGAGVAYAHLGNELTKGSLAGRALQLGDSGGLAAAVGLDMDLGSKWFVNVDARWMDIDSSTKIDGLPQGTIELDPYLFGLSLGRRLR